jgi:hypothetical protein
MRLSSGQRLLSCSYAVLIDGEVKKEGSLFEDFDPPINPPETIPDPEDKKPEDWVDEAKCVSGFGFFFSCLLLFYVPLQCVGLTQFALERCLLTLACWQWAWPSSCQPHLPPPPPNPHCLFSAGSRTLMPRSPTTGMRTPLGESNSTGNTRTSRTMQAFCNSRCLSCPFYSSIPTGPVKRRRCRPPRLVGPSSLPSLFFDRL